MDLYTRLRLWASSTVCESLRLCPGDNLSQRTWLGSVLLRLGRNSDALYFSQFQIEQFFEYTPVPYGGTLFDSPKRFLLTEEQEASLRRFGPGYILYNAALASFRIWGAEAPEPRQFLRLAAHANPQIMLKIIAKRTRPGARRAASFRVIPPCKR